MIEKLLNVELNLACNIADGRDEDVALDHVQM